MSREFNKWLIAVLTPPARAIGFVLGNVYSLLFGWYDKRRRAENQNLLEQEVRDRMSFLAERKPRIVPNTEARNLRGLNASLVTIAVEGLLLRFIRWREVFQVHVASERMPNDWHELSLVLSLIDPAEKIQRGAIRDFTDLSR